MLTEFGSILFALAAEAPELKLQVPQLLFVGEEGVDFDEVRLQRGIFGAELIGKLGAAQSVDAHFECEYAIETPGVVGEQLDESAFASAHGPEFFEEIGDVVFVGGGIVGGEQDGAAGECGFDGVEGGFGFAFRGLRAGRELGVSAVGGELGGGDGWTEVLTRGYGSRILNRYLGFRS